MDSSKSNRRVVRSWTAVRQLDEIWQWNIARYGRSHADSYSRYLEEAIDALATGYEKGETIIAWPNVRHMLIRRKNKGHGHIVVYRVNNDRIDVLRVFHTAQDWRSMSLEDIEP